jgi:TetR/AcrR family transcriptional regulator, transcriptional repressor for nem operon
LSKHSTIGRISYKITVEFNMARPQTFNEESVLHSAMHLFWKKGYANTSVKDLTRVTNLQPGSIYGAFKSKRNLFLLSLDHYFENLKLSVNTILQSKETPIRRIRQFFDFILSQKNDDKDMKSCLLVNTLLEIPPDDEEINERVTSMFLEIEGEFYKVLREAQSNGSLINGGHPASIAKMLMSGIFGLQVYNRMKPDTDALQQIINNLLANIEKS